MKALLLAIMLAGSNPYFGYPNIPGALTPQQQYEIDLQSSIQNACPEGKVCVTPDFVVNHTDHTVYLDVGPDGGYRLSHNQHETDKNFILLPGTNVNNCRGRFSNICK